MWFGRELASSGWMFHGSLETTLLADLWNDFKLLEVRIEELSKQIQLSMQYSDTARRLMTVPGIGPLAASALEASAGNGHQFRNGRFFAVWFRLVPRA